MLADVGACADHDTRGQASDAMTGYAHYWLPRAPVCNHDGQTRPGGSFIAGRPNATHQHSRSSSPNGTDQLLHERAPDDRGLSAGVFVQRFGG
jgi:hypothetical protein